MTTSPLAPAQRNRWLDAALLIAAAGAGLQLYQWLGARPLWLDEEMIAVNLRDRGFADLSGKLWLEQSAPWAWLLLQRLTVTVFGTSERALRLVPVVFGVGTLAAAWWIGRRWMKAVGAAVLVLLVMFGQWLSFYSLELKPYSADVFWSLLLPALAAWAAERSRRVPAFWAAAIVAQLFSNGAALVTPACAAAMVFVHWRQGGWPAARRAAWPALMWLAAFGLHYATTLRYAMDSPVLKEYWAFALPPASAGAAGTLRWLASQLAPFADKPGGAAWPMLLWIAFLAGVGYLLKERAALGLALGLIPLSAFVLAALRLVPLYERLSLWVVPAMYIGVAAGADAAFARTERAPGSMAWPAAVVLAILSLLASADLVQRGLLDLQVNRPRDTNHELDDRAAVQWLAAQRETDDDLATPRQGLPAVWWYGRIRIDGPHLGGGFEQDAGQIFELRHEFPGPACRANTLADRLRNRRRLLVYLGFRMGDVPDGFDEMAIGDLSEFGRVIADRRFSKLSRAVIIDLREPGGRAPQRRGDPPRPPGCVTLKPAQHW